MERTTLSSTSFMRTLCPTESLSPPMCFGTYVVSYSCGHVSYTPDVCLTDIAPHYRCEPKGMKITQPPGRCIECFARDLEPEYHLTTTARFNPDPTATVNYEQKPQPSARSSMESMDLEQTAAITRWWVQVCQGCQAEPTLTILQGFWEYSHQGWVHRTFQIRARHLCGVAAPVTELPALTRKEGRITCSMALTTRHILLHKRGRCWGGVYNVGSVRVKRIDAHNMLHYPLTASVSACDAPWVRQR
jgi:hypothetical protein